MLGPVNITVSHPHWVSCNNLLLNKQIWVTSLLLCPLFAVQSMDDLNGQEKSLLRVCVCELGYWLWQIVRGGSHFWLLGNCFVRVAFHRRISFSVSMAIRAFLLFFSHLCVLTLIAAVWDEAKINAVSTNVPEQMEAESDFGLFVIHLQWTGMLYHVLFCLFSGPPM